MVYDMTERCLCGHMRSNHASESDNTPPSTDIRTGRTRFLVQDGKGACRWKPGKDEVGHPCECPCFAGKMNGTEVTEGGDE